MPPQQWLSPISERDLRRIKIRYKDGSREVAAKTLREGRPYLGMPAWSAD